MKVQIDPHTLERALERGVTEEEILDVLATGSTIPAKGGRLGKVKIYPFRRNRLGTYYPQKRIEVIYALEDDQIVTVTVYAFYGEWENEQ